MGKEMLSEDNQSLLFINTTMMKIIEATLCLNSSMPKILSFVHKSL